MSDRAQILNDNQEAMRIILEGNQVGIWTALPGIVTSVNFDEVTCEVQPAIQGVVESSDGTLTPVNLPLLVDVPIVFPGAGGFTITFPLAAGDEVLVIFASRCIDAWWQSGGVQQAIEARMHDLSDGFALLSPRSQARVSGIPTISPTTIQVRSDDGTNYIEIAQGGGINIVTPQGVSISGNLNVEGTIHFTGDVLVDGHLNATFVTGGGIPLGTHKHIGVTTGTGTSGGPTP